MLKRRLVPVAPPVAEDAEKIDATAEPIRCRPGIRGRAGLCGLPGCLTCANWEEQGQGPLRDDDVP